MSNSNSALFSAYNQLVAMIKKVSSMTTFSEFFDSIEKEILFHVSFNSGTGWFEPMTNMSDLGLSIGEVTKFTTDDARKAVVIRTPELGNVVVFQWHAGRDILVCNVTTRFEQNVDIELTSSIDMGTVKKLLKAISEQIKENLNEEDSTTPVFDKLFNASSNKGFHKAWLDTNMAFSAIVSGNYSPNFQLGETAKFTTADGCRVVIVGLLGNQKVVLFDDNNCENVEMVAHTKLFEGYGKTMTAHIDDHDLGIFCLYLADTIDEKSSVVNSERKHLLAHLLAGTGGFGTPL